jgi:hypothetical protein
MVTAMTNVRLAGGFGVTIDREPTDATHRPHRLPVPLPDKKDSR